MFVGTFGMEYQFDIDLLNVMVQTAL